MPIDASVYNLAGRGVRSIADYDADAANAKQNQLLNLMGQAKMDEYQRGIAENNKLNQLYAGAVGADGAIDRTKLLTGAAAGGMGSRIPGMQDKFAAQDKAQGEVSKQKIDLIDSKLKQSRQYLAGVQTPEDYLRWHEANHADPVLGPELAARGVTAEKSRAMIAQALQQPGGLEKLIQQSAVGMDKFTELNKPTLKQVDSGQTIEIQSFPGMGGAPSVVGSTKKVQSLESIASNATSRRGQDMADRRSKDANDQAKEASQNVYDPERGILINKATGLARPAATLDGKSVAPKDKPMTDAQSKAALFGSRMQSANEILDNLAKAGTTTSMPGLNAGMGLGATLNTVASAGQQQLMQAKRDFVNATLRRESGAVISESEFDNAEKQYFPQVGDSPEVKRQKANNRAIAIRGVQAEVPKANRGVINEVIGSPVASGGFKYLGVAE